MRSGRLGDPSAALGGARGALARAGPRVVAARPLRPAPAPPARPDMRNAAHGGARRARAAGRRRPSLPLALASPYAFSHLAPLRVLVVRRVVPVFQCFSKAAIGGGGGSASGLAGRPQSCPRDAALARGAARRAAPRPAAAAPRRRMDETRGRAGPGTRTAGRRPRIRARTQVPPGRRAARPPAARRRARRPPAP